MDSYLPGEAEFFASAGVVDSPVNRTVYRMAFHMTRTFNDVTSGQMVVKRLYSAELDAWTMWVCWTVPSGLAVPIVMFSQDEVFQNLRMSCGEPDCDGTCIEQQDLRDAQTPRPEKPAHDSTSEDGAFLHTVESLVTDPQLIETFSKLDALFADTERRRGDEDNE